MDGPQGSAGSQREPGGAVVGRGAHGGRADPLEHRLVVGALGHEAEKVFSVLEPVPQVNTQSAVTTAPTLGTWPTGKQVVGCDKSSNTRNLAHR